MRGSQAYTLLAMTAFVAAMVGVLAFALARFLSEARRVRRGSGGSTHDQSAFMTATLSAALARPDLTGGSPTSTAPPAAWYRELAALLAGRLREDVSDVRRVLETADPTVAGPAGLRLAAAGRQAEAALTLTAAQDRIVPVDLHALVQRTAADRRGVTRDRGGDLVVQGRFAPVTADEGLLRYLVTHAVERVLAGCDRAGVAPVVTLTGQAEPGSATVRLSITGNGTVPVGESPASDVPADRIEPGGSADDLSVDLMQRIVARWGGACRSGTGAMGGEQITIDLPRRSEP